MLSFFRTTVRTIVRAAPLTITAVFLASCGGGGGGGGGGGTSTVSGTTSASGTGNQQTSFSTAKYAGFYLSSCNRVPDATNLENNAPLYGQLYQVVRASSTDSAPIEWRLDLYDNATCSDTAVGYVENKNVASKFTVIGQTSINGQTVDKVIVTFGTADSTAKVSSTANTVVIGKAIRLSLPSVLFSAIQYSDIWLVEAGKLYEGGEVLGADGFPVAINAATPSKQLASALALPPEPCAAKAVSWQLSASTCSSTLAPKASGALADITDTTAPATGAARFSCTNGIWSEPIAASCSEPAPIPLSYCPQATLTWTVGAYSCAGRTSDVPGTSFGLMNTPFSDQASTGNRGSGYFVCSAAAGWVPDAVFAVANTCAPVPPPTPPITDPLLLASAKNCLICHGLVTPIVGPSFKNIADFYRASPPAAGVLEAKIKGGGAGKFGSLPMPANPQVDDNDLAILVPWILSQ